MEKSGTIYSQQTLRKRKRRGIIFTGGTSALTTGTGIALMAFGGPCGVIAGGIILGAGVSGGISTTQQALSKNDKFDYKKWGVCTGIGAAGGAIATPISLAGTALTSTVAASAASKVAI
jgi:hypothetical protein